MSGLQLSPIPNFLASNPVTNYYAGANAAQQNALNQQKMQQNKINLSTLGQKNLTDIQNVQAEAQQKRSGAGLNDAMANWYGPKAQSDINEANARTMASNVQNTIALINSGLTPSGNAPVNQNNPFGVTQGGNVPTSNAPPTGQTTQSNPNAQMFQAGGAPQSSGGQLPMSPQQVSNLQNTFGNGPQTVSPQQMARTVNIGGQQWQLPQTQSNQPIPGVPPGAFVTPQMQRATTQAAMEAAAKANIGGYNKLMDDATTGANAAYQVIQNADQFKNAYDKSHYKGGLSGALPVGGNAENPLASAPMELIAQSQDRDLSNEQLADQAAQRMQAQMARTMVQGTGGRMTNMDMILAGRMKPNRTLDPQAAQTSVNIVKGFAQRALEAPQFYNAAMNMGIDQNTAKTLFNLYDIQRPVVNPDGTLNDQYKNSWADFLSPQAVNAARTHAPFTPAPQSLSQTPQMQSISPADYQTTLQNALNKGKTKDWVDQQLQQRHIRIQ